MKHYKAGYEVYKQACEKHGIDFQDYEFFTIQLTKDQLYAFNEAL